MNEQGISLISFTARGAELMRRLQAALGGEAVFSREIIDFSLAEWSEQRFYQRQALIFVGAVGIAVRAVAPHIKSKAQDPAVVVVDEAGRFVIPLLSGHLGGANALARRLAELLGATLVVTTATDINQRFAVDLWAKSKKLTVIQPDRIKLVSGKLLDGREITLFSRWPVLGQPPAGVVIVDAEQAEQADVTVDIYDHGGSSLQLTPAACVLGVGCRRGIGRDDIERAFGCFCEERRLWPASIRGAASIDIKAEEAGLLAFFEDHHWPCKFFSADELARAEGSFTPSPFVARTVGVDNVCERSAVLAAGGELIEKKYAAGGVTLALACLPPRLDWSW